MTTTNWKAEQRKQLIDARQELNQSEQAALQRAVLETLSTWLQSQQPGILAMYWPIKGEIDCRPLAEKLIDSGWQLAVPIIDPDKKQLIFCEWHPLMPMVAGRWNIPIPQHQTVLKPDVYLIPLVGFDQDYYRLGYGAGYYDRTLESIADSVLKIGVGIEQGRLATIHPHEFDIQMDFIVTETGLHESRKLT